MAGEGGPAKSALTQRLMRKGVNLVLNGIVTNVDETTITYQKDGVEHTIFDADTLVFAVGYTPVPVIHKKAVLIGDCDKVGNLKDAITGAYTAVKNL